MVKRGFTAPHRNQATVVEVEEPPHLRAEKWGGGSLLKHEEYEEYAH